MIDTPAISSAILSLAIRCDGAVNLDGQGFNGRDAAFGRSLAEQLTEGRTLSLRQIDAAARMLRTYRHSQLPAEVWPLIEAEAEAARRTLAGATATVGGQPAEVVNVAARIGSRELPPVGDPPPAVFHFFAGHVAGTGDRLKCRTPFEFKDQIKAVPGARWDKAEKLWHLPISVAAVENLRHALNAWGRPRRVQGDATFRQLVADVDRAAEARQHKTATELDDIPGRTPAWLHQRQAFHAARACDAFMLAMDMGTGKTKTTIGLLEEWSAQRVLILCPSKVLHVWPGEVAKHAVRDWSIVTGTYTKRGGNRGVRPVADRMLEARQAVEHAAVTGSPVVVCVNYEAAWRDPFAAWALKQAWDVIVCDESHRIKTAGAVSSQFAHTVGRRAQRRLCLTGTPMGHSPLDIFGQYRFLDEGLFGTSNHRFKLRYAEWGGFEDREFEGMRADTADEFAELVGRISFQCKADDVLDLPAKHHLTRDVDFSKAERGAYDEMLAHLCAEVEGGLVTAANGAVKVLRLQQITSGYLPVADPDDGRQVASRIGSSKAELLADMLEDFAPREPLVVFCRFVHDLDTVRRVAEESGRTVLELSGRRDDLEAWKAGGADVLAIQIQAGGAGIDLTRTRYALYYSVGWSLTDYEQSLKRLHRPGQVRPVTYYHLNAAGTIDETVYHALRNRKSVIEAVLDAARKAKK